MTRFEHDHPIGERIRVDRIMGDHQRGTAERIEMPAQITSYIPTCPHIERSERFVEQQHARLCGQRPRKRHPLRLPARQCPRTMASMCREADAVEPFGGAPTRLGLAHPTRTESEGNVLERAEMGEQQVVLKHDADMATFGSHERTRRRIIEHVAIEFDPSPIECDEPREAAQRRRLSRSVRPEYGNDFAIGHGDVRIEVEAAELHSERGVEAHQAAPPIGVPPAVAPVPNHRSRSPTNTTNEIAMSNSDSTNAC